jgi:hypothetical protein
MYRNPDRIEQFKAEVADMKLRDPATAVDRVLVRLGVVGMVAGPGLAIVAWFMSYNSDNPLQQRDAIVMGLLGVTIAIVGAALWLKSALAGFLRFWLARLSYEQQAQADRIASGMDSNRTTVPDPSETEAPSPSA